MYIKVQIILLLFGLHLYSAHSIAKFQIENGTEIYEIRELPNKTIEFVNPKRKIPTLREITFYKVIEKPYFSENNDEKNPIKKSDVEEKSNIEEYDFDETLRPFTNSHGYQFIDWGAQETHKDDDQNTFIAPIKKNSDTIPHDIEHTMNGNDDENDKFSDDIKDADDALDYYEDKDDKNTNSNKKEREYYEYMDEDVTKNKHDDDYFDEETEDIAIKKKGDALNKNVKSNKNNSDELFDEEAHDVKDKTKDGVLIKNVDNLKNNTEELNNSTKNIAQTSENATEANVVDSTKKVNDKINETVSTDNDHQGNNDTSSNDEVGRKSDVVKHSIDDIAKRLRSQLFNSTKQKYHTINRHQENAKTEKNRRKRETYYRNVPEAPVLPDLDLDGLPDYLQEMLANRPSIHRKHNEHSFSQSNLNNKSNSPYDLPEPDIEIRNNFNTEEESIEGQDNESSAIFKRNPEEYSEANSHDANQDFDMTDKLKDMFESIENTFIKDEKKPRTYGMKLKDGAGEIWNDILGSPLITVNNPELSEKELKYNNKIHEIYENINGTQEDMISTMSDNINSKESHTEIPSSMESDEIIDDKEMLTEILDGSYINLMPESELPDFKIEHMEQIPRIYRKDEPSTDIPSAEHDNSSTTLTELEQVLQIIKPENMEQNNPETTNSTPNTPERAVRETSKDKLPDDINHKRKMQDSFDNILKRFPHSKSIANNLKAAEDFKTDRDNKEIHTYGMHLEGDQGYVWNELPGTHINVRYMNTAHANAPNLTNTSDIDPDKLIENHSELTNDVIDSSEESISAPDEFKPVESTEDEIKENTNINYIVDKEKELLKKKNTTLVKPDFDDLLKKYDFWQWLTNWTSSQMEILNMRTEKLVKDEVNRQLVQEKLNKTNDQSSLNKETPKHNSTVENNKPEISSTDIVSVTNKDKTNSKLEKGKENANKTEENISKQENKNNNNINAEAIYGNAVVADHVTNIFIFYPNISVSDENVNKLEPVLDKSKSEILISKEVPKNVTFDERLGLNPEEQDDKKNNEPPKDEVTGEISTQTSSTAETDLEKATEVNENSDRTNESSIENQTSESNISENNINPDDKLSINIDESTEHIIDTTTDSNTATLTSEINEPIAENTELDKSEATTQESSDEDATKLLQ